MFYYDENGWLSPTPIEGRSTEAGPPEERLKVGFSWNHIGVAGREWMAMERNPKPITPPEAPKQDLRITGIAFMRRLTQDERIAIRNLAKENDVAFDFMDLLNKSTVVHLDDVDVVNGIGMMEAIGKIEKGRSAEILGAAIQPGERP